VLALDAAKGTLIWDKEVIAIEDKTTLNMHGKNSQASPTPIFESGRIYAHFGHHGTACLDEAGTVLWTSRENPYAPVHGTGGSPVIVDDLLIFNADAKENPVIIALDKATGKTRWKVARTSEATRKFSFCTPLVITVAGQKQVISPGSGVVYALKPRDGSIIWSVRYGQGYSVVPRPVFANGLLFLSSGFDKPVALAIRPDGTGDVTDTHVAWTFNKNVPRNASMSVIGDELYMLDDGGILSCLDCKTGTAHWQERVLGPCSASLLSGDGHLYAADEKGTTVVVQPGKTFNLLATNSLNEKLLATPSICGSDLLIRTEAHLYRVAKP
jgi:outer membrane protein assembly factor BamB